LAVQFTSIREIGFTRKATRSESCAVAFLFVAFTLVVFTLVPPDDIFGKLIHAADALSF